MSCEIPCRVVRLISDCCGMKVGHIYEAKTTIGRHYLTAKVGTDEDGDPLWTTDHWTGIGSPNVYFSFIETADPAVKGEK